MNIAWMIAALWCAVAVAMWLDMMKEVEAKSLTLKLSANMLLATSIMSLLLLLVVWPGVLYKIVRGGK